MKKNIILSIIILCVLFLSCAKRNNINLRKSIVNDAKKYLGIKYKYGGTTSSGFDCSGFVQFIYAKNGIMLPRTVGEIQKGLKRIKTPLIGDFVVYNDPKHIGIYIGKGKFIHASSSRGIVIDKLNNDWFKKRFVGFYTYFY